MYRYFQLVNKHRRPELTLKMIETLTYSCQDAQQLATVNSKVQDIFSNMKSNMPQSDGLVIRPMIAKRAKPISQKYRSQLALINNKYCHLTKSGDK